MNARREGIDILTQSPFNTAEVNHYDNVLLHLQNNPNLACLLVTVVTVYFLLKYFPSVPSSLVRLLWDITVFLTPSRIVAALDSKGVSPDSADEVLQHMGFQAKSEAMQRILGLDNASFSSLLPRAPSLAGFGNALLGNRDNLPSGLGNWDNSCYQNSIIQGLASLKSFAVFLERNIEMLGSKMPFPTHQALKGIIERLNSPDNYGQRLWTPPDLKSMSSWQQQDAQEYFSKVVDQIDYEVHQATRRRTSNLGLKIAGPQEHVVGSFLGHGSSTDPTVKFPTFKNQNFRNPLEGLLAQRVGCMKCGWTEGLSLIPFNCLTVPLGEGFEYDVRDCLDHYMHLEPIEGVECAKCTLLRTQGQLRSILQQIEEDRKLSQTDNSSEVSGALQKSVKERLQAVEEALLEDDFTEKTLSKKCHIPSKHRVSSTKSRQAVIARPPKCFAIHINRSVFDENTGMLRKNYAAVKFPKILDLNEWCLGAGSQGEVDQAIENWGIDPKISMLPQPGAIRESLGRLYELRAVVTHYGRHENGHYICYRKYSTKIFPAHVPEAVLEADGEKEKSERWYRLSDEDVQMVSEDSVMSQGGAFMLFYEEVEQHVPSSVKSADVGAPVSTSSHTSPEDLFSITSMVTDYSASETSQATSISTFERAESISGKVQLNADID